MTAFADARTATGNYPQNRGGDLRRGRSLLGREEDVHESGLSLFKRATLRRKRPDPAEAEPPKPKRLTGGACLGDIPGPVGPWMIYCWLLTAWIPTPAMRVFGESPPNPHCS